MWFCLQFLFFAVEDSVSDCFKGIALNFWRVVCCLCAFYYM